MVRRNTNWIRFHQVTSCSNARRSLEVMLDAEGGEASDPMTWWGGCSRNAVKVVRSKRGDLPLSETAAEVRGLIVPTKAVKAAGGKGPRKGDAGRLH